MLLRLAKATIPDTIESFLEVDEVMKELFLVF